LVKGFCTDKAAAALSGLTPLRPQQVPPLTEWLTAGAKAQMRRRGRCYHEVELGEDFQISCYPQVGWVTDRFAEGHANGQGVGDDQHGWAADGARGMRWHKGPKEARWPRAWRRSRTVS